MLKAHIEIYTERGNELSKARRLLEIDDQFLSALALVSVHSGIAFNDALLARFDRSALGDEDHSKAAELTAKECRARRIESGGLAQLRKLLAAKTKISYSPDRVTQQMATALSVAADRFEAWFYKTLEELS